MKKISIFFYTIFSLVTSSVIFAQSTRVIGYVPTWGNFTGFTNSFDYQKVSHLAIAFANPDANGNIDEGLSTTVLNNFIAKAHSEGVKVMISLGGATANDAWLTLMKSSERAAFITKIIDYATLYGFDVIDMDLEGSKVTSDYEGFVTDLAVQCQANNIELSAAVASWHGYDFTDQALAAFDFINLMAYDATGPWNLNNPGQHSSMAFAQSDLNYWVNTRGIAAEKCVLGVPFYGYDFGNNGLGTKYSTIVAMDKSYAYQDQVGQLYYNGKSTIGAKTTLGTLNYGGIMIWELTQDTNDETSLLDTIYQNIRAQNLFIGQENRPPIVEVTKPQTSAVYAQGFSVDFEASCSDIDGTVTAVYFILSGDTVAQFSGSGVHAYTAPSLTSGTYQFAVSAYDEDGAERISKTISFTVEVSTPVITVSTPLDLDTFKLGNDIALDFTVSDSLFSISSGVVIWHNDTVYTFDSTGLHQVVLIGALYGLQSVKIVVENSSTASKSVQVNFFVYEQAGAFQGTAAVIPGTLEAENYDVGGYLVSYYDVDTNNFGGSTLRGDAVDIENYVAGKYNLGYLEVGEWLLYTVDVTVADTFQVYANVAATSAGGSFTLYAGDTILLTSQTVSSTGSWTSFQEKNMGHVILPVGTHTLKLMVTGAGFNLDYLRFDQVLNPLYTELQKHILVKVFPNPSSEILNVVGLDSEFSYSISCLNGKLVDQGQCIGKINVTNLKAGVYYLFVQKDGQNIPIKWIKI